MAVRYGVYYTPPRGSMLARQAASWLGRDAWTGAEVAFPEVGDLGADDLAALTQAPRLYGFHGTIKAPFRLAEHVDHAGLCAALGGFAGAARPVVIERLDLHWIGSFLALVCEAGCDDLNDLAAGVVRHVEPFRAPLTDAEIARRRPDSLSPRQKELLEAWGYPHVFDEFRFHMTLTGRVNEQDRDAVQAAAEAVFAPWLGKKLAVERLTLFEQPAAGEPFKIDRDWPLQGGQHDHAREADLAKES